MNHDRGFGKTKHAMGRFMIGDEDSEVLPRITVFDTMEHEGAARVAASLAAEITAGFGPRGELPLSIVARAGDEVLGGLNASTHWGWCYIRHLWVKEGWRRRGLALRLLNEAETQARARQCVGIYVDTFDEGAASFYARAGFSQFGRIENFPPEHSRIFLQKRLPLA